MLANWTRLSDDLQLCLAQNAMRHAAAVIAEQAEALALAIEGGTLADRGGPEALRLLAAVIRVAGRDTTVPAGHC